MMTGMVVEDARKAVTALLRMVESRRQLGKAIRLMQRRGALPDDLYEIAVYFADNRVNLYQIRQWYAPLAALAQRHPVVVIARSPDGAVALAEECPLPVQFLQTAEDLETFVARQRLRLVFYVNQNIRNFQMLWFGRLLHVFVSHGESDKSYMSSGQIGAYDYALVGGQAALDRLDATLWNYDVAARAIPIGRPQIDHSRAAASPLPSDGRIAVLYAPTCEGDRPSMRYGSVASHGEALVSALLGDPRFRLIYRAHPRTGTVDPGYRAAHARIVAAIAAANAADPAAQHVHDDGPEVGWQLAHADVAILDVSAMVYDRLAFGGPLLVTRPVDARAEIDRRGYLAECEWLDAADAAGVAELIPRMAADEAAAARLARWSEHYFGDTAPGAATSRFQDAVERLLGEWSRRRQATEPATDRGAATASAEAADDDLAALA